MVLRDSGPRACMSSLGRKGVGALQVWCAFFITPRVAGERKTNNQWLCVRRDWRAQLRVFSGQLSVLNCGMENLCLRC